jgi:hypothetical protein
MEIQMFGNGIFFVGKDDVSRNIAIDLPES